MRIKKIIKTVRDAVRDPNRALSERVFTSLTIISELTVLVAFIGDVITGENIRELILLSLVLVLVPVVTLSCLFKNRLKIAIRMIIAGLVFVVLPALFFNGGGVEGGGVLWFIFAFMYVGLVITGTWRVILTVVLSLTAAGCYLAEYYHPEWVTRHTRAMFYEDSLLSLILVGIVCSVMAWLQGRLFSDESERARKEAERAEELTRSQNRFFSSMSHEIRTPINSILGLNELILRNQDATDEIVKDATGIQGAGKLLLALINDILDFSKIEAGSMDIVPVDYRIGELLSEVVNMIWLKASEKELKFNVNIDPAIPSVLYGDEVRIKQIIINLLNNAVKYTAEGSVELHIEMEDVEGDPDKKELLISVSDTGMGIKKEALPHLFDAFKRVDEKKNRYIEGTGLGLNIVKQLVELMGGDIKVNSIYGEGSTFTATIIQGVSDPVPIGELNIHNQGIKARTVYESSFQAPEARILIVDDNEMNLEVECRLMHGTEMNIDTADSGSRALDLCNVHHYDVILMDHLMPGMDGIECLEHLRDQSGSLNRSTPVIVLTANAGSETRELYSRAGFDGYLVKPVSGAALEEMLMTHLPREKVILRSKMVSLADDINTLDGYVRKEPVAITVTSLCDLPDDITERLNLHIIPFKIRTEEGVFKDNVQMSSDELIRYMYTGKSAVSFPPDGEDYTEFFAEVLKKAHHIIHIAITTSMSEDYKISTETAKSFDNVTVVNSECVSSATGILCMIACKLAQQNLPVPEIVQELEIIRQRLKCSFVMETTEYIAKRGLISQRVSRFARAFNLHPSLTIRDNMTGIGGIWMGRTRSAYKKYIRSVFPVDIIPDSEVVFITYVDLPAETLLWIKEEVSRYAFFEHVIFMQASAAICSNCGPGTFGILYFVKSNKSYNIGSFITEYDEAALMEAAGTGSGQSAPEEAAEETEAEESPEEEGEDGGNAEEVPDEKSGEAEPAWYLGIEGIDGETAIKNSGSEEAFRTVLKIYYESVPGKSSELQGFYEAEKWDDYTIKVHALKSSAKLIGAMELSEEAQRLEDAGKSSDIDYIREHHEPFLKDYRRYRQILDGIFGGGEEDAPDKPPADEALLQSLFERLREAAEDMDCDAVEEILRELDGYAVPDSEKKRLQELKERAERFDYDGIVEILEDP